jgi:hypothetical protein
MSSKTFFEICEEFFESKHPNINEENERDTDYEPVNYYSYLKNYIIKMVVFYFLGYDHKKEVSALKYEVY